MADLVGGAFAQAIAPGDSARLLFEPTRKGVLSWNTFAESGTMSFRLLRAHAPATPWLDLARWQPGGSTSLSPMHDGVSVDVDVIVAELPFDGIDVRAPRTDLNLVAFASSVRNAPSLPFAADAMILDVPLRSQFGVEGEFGWCSPASLSMINAYHGIEVSVEETARAVFDRAYNGSGNWSFNVAYSGSLGLRATVAFLRNLDHAQRLIERSVPIAISCSWSDGELPGAPLPRSDGHLAVLCGFTRNGDCAVNDPAHRAVRVAYPRAALERAWQRSNGAAYVIAPAGIDYADVLDS